MEVLSERDLLDTFRRGVINELKDRRPKSLVKWILIRKKLIAQYPQLNDDIMAAWFIAIESLRYNKVRGEV